MSVLIKGRLASLANKDGKKLFHPPSAHVVFREARTRKGAATRAALSDEVSYELAKELQEQLGKIGVTENNVPSGDPDWSAGGDSTGDAGDGGDTGNTEDPGSGDGGGTSGDLLG